MTTGTVGAIRTLLAAVDSDDPPVTVLTIHGADRRITIDTGRDRRAAGEWATILHLDEPVRVGQPRELTTAILARDHISTGRLAGWRVEVVATVYGGRP